MITVVDTAPVGDDSFAYEVDVMGVPSYFLDVRAGNTRVVLEVGQVDDVAAAATAAAEIMLDRL